VGALLIAWLASYATYLLFLVSLFVFGGAAASFLATANMLVRERWESVGVAIAISAASVCVTVLWGLCGLGVLHQITASVCGSKPDCVL
jgi:ABC-type sulfate transport system permease component